MPLSTVVILGVIVAMFAAFIVAVGGVASWQVLSDLRDAKKTVKREASGKAGSVDLDIRKAA